MCVNSKCLIKQISNTHTACHHSRDFIMLYWPHNPSYMLHFRKLENMFSVIRASKISTTVLRLRTIKARPVTCYSCLKVPSALCSTFTNTNASTTLKYINVDCMDATFYVGYEDFGPKDGRVIVAVHGAPGHSDDFKVLFAPLYTMGFRVIAINFPGNVHSFICSLV